MLPGDCSAVGQAWIDNLQTVRPLIAKAYEAVRRELRTTPVVVVPYPIPIEREKGSCDYSMFSANEHQSLSGFTEQLNAMLRREAADHGFYFLDDMATALENRQICDGDPDDVGVNFLAANGVNGLLEQQANPRNWLHISMHPNESGHAMAAVLRRWLEEEASLQTTGPPDRVPTVTAPSVGNECVEDQEVRTCAAEWSRRAQAAFLRFPASFVVVLVLGAWFLALAIIRWWRRRGEQRSAELLLRLRERLGVTLGLTALARVLRAVVSGVRSLLRLKRSEEASSQSQGAGVPDGGAS